MDFTNKYTIVTGGANGIGRCITEKFIQLGAYVIFVDLNEEAGSLLCKKINNTTASEKVLFICGDIAEKRTIENLIDTISSHGISAVDFVINNACTNRRGLLSGCSWDDFEYVQRVGVTAPYYLVSELYKAGCLAKGASIVNIASTRGMQSQADTEAYSAAKGGILALTHALSISLAGHARVNAISPGWIDTAAYHMGGNPTNHSKEDEKQHPAGRVGQPSDIAEIVMFLCDNDRAGFITGENIIIDGGMSKLMIYHGDKGWEYTNKGANNL